jgi:hypothetical protein
MVKYVKLTLIDEYLPWMYSSNLGVRLDVIAISYAIPKW